MTIGELTKIMKSDTTGRFVHSIEDPQEVYEDTGPGWNIYMDVTIEHGIPKEDVEMWTTDYVYYGGFKYMIEYLDFEDETDKSYNIRMLKI